MESNEGRGRHGLGIDANAEATRKKKLKLLVLSLFLVSVVRLQRPHLSGAILACNVGPPGTGAALLTAASNLVAAQSLQLSQADREFIQQRARSAQLSRRTLRRLLKLIKLILRQQRISLRSVWVLPRQKVWWFDYAQHYTGDRWVQNFRLQRNVFAFVCEQIHPDVVRQDTNYRPAIPVTQRVAAVIYCIAHSANSHQISELFGIGQSTVCTEVEVVLTAICVRLGGIYVRFPFGPLRPPQNDPNGRPWYKIPFSEWTSRTVAEVKAAFQQRGAQSGWSNVGIPGVCGALDGSHIEIEPPRGQLQESFRNYKKFYSVHLQAVADADFCFSNIFVGCAGANHDSTVYNFSELSGLLMDEGEELLEGGYLVADAAYAASQTIVTPYPGANLNEIKQRFNHVHSSTRMAIEQAFGILKNQWRILMYKIDSRNFRKLMITISACCILHNIRLVHNSRRNRRGRAIVRPTERLREQRRLQRLESLTANPQPLDPELEDALDAAGALRNSIATNL